MKGSWGGRQNRQGTANRLMAIKRVPNETQSKVKFDFLHATFLYFLFLAYFAAPGRNVGEMLAISKCSVNSVSVFLGHFPFIHCLSHCLSFYFPASINMA